MANIALNSIKFRLLKKAVSLLAGHWFRERNPRKDYGSQTELAEVRANFHRFGGWNSLYMVTAELPNEEDVTAAITERKEILDMVCQPGPGDPARKLATATLLKHFWTNKDGSIKAPEFVGVDCNRRSAEFVEYVVDIMLGVSGAGKALSIEEIDTTVPVRVPDNKEGRFPNEFIRTEFAVLENETKTAGAKTMAPSELLRVVTKQLRYGTYNKQSDVERMGITGNKRVEYYFAARFAGYDVDHNLGIRFLDRVDPTVTPPILKIEGKDVGNPEYIDFRSIKQLDWQGPSKEGHPYHQVAMGLMVDESVDLSKTNDERTRSGKPALQRPLEMFDGDVSATHDYLEEWLESKKGTTGGAMQKIAPKATIQNWATTHPISVVKLVAKAVNDGGNAAVMTPLVDRESCLNAVMRLTPAVATEVANLIARLEKAGLNEAEQVFALKNCGQEAVVSK